MSKRENNIHEPELAIFIELVLQMLVGNADQIMVGWYDTILSARSATPTKSLTCCSSSSR